MLTLGGWHCTAAGEPPEEAKRCREQRDVARRRRTSRRLVLMSNITHNLASFNEIKFIKLRC